MYCCLVMSIATWVLTCVYPNISLAQQHSGCGHSNSKHTYYNIPTTVSTKRHVHIILVFSDFLHIIVLWLYHNSFHFNSIAVKTCYICIWVFTIIAVACMTMWDVRLLLLLHVCYCYISDWCFCNCVVHCCYYTWVFVKNSSIIEN